MSGRRRLVVEADGGSRGNPGVAGYGALVRDPEDGAVLVERAGPLGKESNNVAEYTGLIRGLEAARRVDPGADVEVRMDSKLVVEQMSGRWKIKHEDMRRLALEARELCSAIRSDGGSVTFTWIPRGQNTAADALSNDGMDGERIDRTLESAAAPRGGPLDGTASGAGDPVVADAAERTEAGGAPADLGAPTRVVLVRHAVTVHTTGGRLDGRGGADPDLDPTGREQAQALARRLRAWLPEERPLVVTSSLRRAVSTGVAVAAALGVEATTDRDWDEQAFGGWDGKSLAQVAARWPDDLARLRTDPTFAPAGGETHDDVVARVRAAYARALGAAGPGGCVVVVAHRKPLYLVIAEVLGLGLDAFWTLGLSPASISEIDVWRDGTTLVRCVNDTAHLG